MALGLGIVAVCALFIPFYLRRWRRAALNSLLVRLGFSLESESPPALLLELKNLPILKQGSRHSLRNVARMRLSARAELVFAELRYLAKSVKGSRFESRGLLAIIGDYSLPDFCLLPSLAGFADALGVSNLVPKVEKLMVGRLVPGGMKRVDLAHDTQFSRHFTLWGKDEPGLRELFSPALCESLKNANLKHLLIEGGRRAIATYTRRVEPKELEGWIAERRPLLEEFFKNL